MILGGIRHERPVEEARTAGLVRWVAIGEDTGVVKPQCILTSSLHLQVRIATTTYIFASDLRKLSLLINQTQLNVTIQMTWEQRERNT